MESQNPGIDNWNVSYSSLCLQGLLWTLDSQQALENC